MYLEEHCCINQTVKLNRVNSSFDMPIRQDVLAHKGQRLAAWYNTVPSFAWSVLNLAPPFIYVYRFLDLQWLWVLVPLCIAPYFLHKNFIDRLALSRTREFYIRLGVDVVQEFVQHGGMVNRLIRRRYPTYRIVFDKTTVHRQLSATYMFERFHLGMAVAFCVLLLHAAFSGRWEWVLLLLVCNFIYNVYPVLLQQYMRIRLKHLLG